MLSMEQPFIDAIAAKQIEGVILQAGSTIGATYSKALGNRTLLDGTEKPLSTSDILFLASATKLLTTVAALQCCDKSLLSLDEDLASKLPEVVSMGVLVAKEGSPTVEELRKPLTLRHML